MVTTVMWVKGRQVGAEFPDTMPAAVRAQVVRSVLNGVHHASRQQGGVRDVAAYFEGGVRRKASTWATPGWPPIAMIFLREAHRRRSHKPAMDPVSIVRTLRDDPRGYGRIQLAAVAGHDPACPGDCRACRALDRGDWEAYAAASGMDPMSAENAHASLEDAGLVGRVRPAPSSAARARRAPVDPWAL